MSATYRELLSGNKDFRRLWIGQVISELGNWFSFIAQLGLVRTLYFSILVPHIVLAVPVVPLALLTLYRGWTANYARHRAIARVTLPLWLFVSVSGVVVYLMLYHL